MIDNLIIARKEKLFYYSEANYIKKIKPEVHHKIVREKLESYFNSTSPDSFCLEIQIANKIHYFLVDFLKWDSDFFARQIYRVFTVIYDHQDFDLLREAVAKFREILAREYGCQYCFIEIPSEDILLIQTLTVSGFKLVETRLACYFDLSKFNHPRRYQVRKATTADIPSLSKAAATMKNNYDRFHAEVAITENMAGDFLAKYIEEGVKGYLDMVLVPATNNSPPDGFVSYNYQEDKWQTFGCKVAKLILTAVLFETRKGWFYRLSVEMLRDLQEKGLEFAHFQTQSANRVMYKTMEKLGSRYGGSSHILSLTF